VCARFLHEIYSCYIPEFDGNLSVAREANRVWPVSLPEETDIFIANKIVDQLRHLLHRKLMEEDGKIQMLYNQMKNDKRRMSHGELSSSGDVSQEDEDRIKMKFRRNLTKLVEEMESSQGWSKC
jgi:hypothetical protein